ncbi:F-box protein [Melia azedarach]|uniref:F-box protein n=1 Tax=Melia azedarach TaxID=155640 RepID=A0ACC1XSG6_MELAZ|nr:F-box protein [Melia azedarach]
MTKPDTKASIGLAFAPCQNICHHGGDISRKAVICIKGILHWLTSSSKILAFNVQDEKSSVISAPLAYLPADDEPLYAWCIGEPDDKLHYVMVSNYGLDVWSLEDYVESKWNLRSSESLEMIIEENQSPQKTILHAANELLGL